MPIAARDVAAAAGALLVLAAAVSVVGTVIIPRKTGSHLTRLVDRLVAGVFRLITRPVRRYELRDRLAAGQAAVILLVQLAMWLATFYVGFALLVWPLTADITTAFSTAGPALWTFGSADAHGFYEKALLDVAAMTALVTVTLQIAYLPTLYAAFNRRETEIGLHPFRRCVPCPASPTPPPPADHPPGPAPQQFGSDPSWGVQVELPMDGPGQRAVKPPSMRDPLADAVGGAGDQRGPSVEHSSHAGSR